MHAHRPLVDFALGPQFCPGGRAPRNPHNWWLRPGVRLPRNPHNWWLRPGVRLPRNPHNWWLRPAVWLLSALAVRLLPDPRSVVGHGCSASAGPCGWWLRAAVRLLPDPAVGGWARLFSFP